MNAIYARQSVDKKDSISIESQIEYCKREVLEDEEIKIYSDKGYSGKNIERPDFQRLLDDIKKGTIKKIIVYKLDRISRSISDFSKLLEEFNKYNVEFVSCTEKFDTSTPVGRAMVSVVMVFAQLERETTQERVTDAYYDRAKMGIFMGGTVPYGFDTIPHIINGINTKKFVFNNNINYITHAYSEYAKGYSSLNDLAFNLNKAGARTIEGNMWTASTLSALLKNPVYAKADIYMYNYLKSLNCVTDNDISDFDGKRGLIVFGNKKNAKTKKQSISGYTFAVAPHIGAIDGQIWIKCQDRLKMNKSIKNSGNTTRSWIAGLTRCGKCHGAMGVNTSSRLDENGNKKTYFRCYKRAATNNLACDAKSVRASGVEQFIFDKLSLKVINLSVKKDRKKQECDTIMKEAKILILTKQTEINNLLDSLAQASSVSMKYINEKIEKLDSEILKLNKSISTQSNEELTVEKIIELNSYIEKWDILSIEDKKNVAKYMISSIIIKDRVEDIEIEWKY